MDQRRVSHKALPLSPMLSQQKRRERALEEQKRKRALQIESTRHLDAFSNLTLNNAASDDEIDEPEIVREGVAHLTSLLPPNPARNTPDDGQSTGTSNGRRRNKRKGNNQYAEKCMYAELLELRKDAMEYDNAGSTLPEDLTTNWIALAPIPKGKRCLAVALLMNGNPSSVPTTLHSRLKGKKIVSFPSPLPPDTILDCILDEGWKESGILHVLDVVRWHGQNIGDGECSFRLWWRDMRLAELQSLAIPPSKSHPNYTFPYPISFLPVPSYFAPTTEDLLSTIIPTAGAERRVKVYVSSTTVPTEGDMETDPTPEPRQVVISSDGLLLYHAQASYEPGTSPLALWVPCNADTSTETSLDALHRHILEPKTAQQSLAQ